MALNTENLPPQVQQKLKELQAIRDDVRVRLHLASMEAKNNWNELESKLDDLEQRAASEGQVTKQATVELAQNLLQSARNFRDRLQQ